jgi:hypothetical protein
MVEATPAEARASLRVGRPLLPPVEKRCSLGDRADASRSEKEQWMRYIVKHAAAGALLGGSLLASAGVGLAGAEPPASNAVDLAIGNIMILQNASLDTAATVAGAVCNIDAEQANSLAQKATAEGSQQTVCNLPRGVVTFSQAGAINGGAGPAPAVGTPNSPMNPMEPMYPSEQQPQMQPR